MARDLIGRKGTMSEWDINQFLEILLHKNPFQNYKEHFELTMRYPISAKPGRSQDVEYNQPLESSTKNTAPCSHG
jgi:hypothetical protein